METITNKIGNITKIFARTFEEEAYRQIETLANHEAYLNSKIRIMPDAHAGKGCTVGTTMTITDKVTPNLVGVDVGCGMLAVKLLDKEIDFKKLDRIIKTKIPHGFNVHKEQKAIFDFSYLRCKDFVNIERAKLSIGSLGGGNHFIEVGVDDDGSYFLIIHSGSRNLGTGVCKHYQDLAIKNLTDRSEEVKELIEKLKEDGREKDIQSEIKKLQLPNVNRELAYLTGSDFDDYMNDMRITQEFAYLNRIIMSDIIINEMGFEVESAFVTIHNYIDFDDMILRKGAVSAKKGELLLIPINMRDGSILAVGKGNEDWNYSAPHGAGRLMSRTKAKENINIEEFKETMKDVYSTSVNKSTLDEAPQVYKSIDEIIETTKDTIDIISILKPVYNFKSH